MLGGFYGFTAVTLGLSPVSIVSYSEMVKALDTATNRIQLIHFKKDLEELLKSLGEVSKGYSTSEGRRAHIMLSRKRYKSDEEKANLEKFLEKESVTVSEVQVDKNGNNVKLSPLAKSVLEYLVSSAFLDRINFFLNKLQYSGEESGVTVLGSKLHLLIQQPRGSLDSRIARIYKKRFTLRDVNKLEEQVEILESYKKDIIPMETQDRLGQSIEKAKMACGKMNIDYFNSLFFSEEVNYTIEDYYGVSKELYQIGIVGFTPFIKMCQQEFLSSCSRVGTSDLGIYPGSDLYSFVDDLREALDSYKAIGGEKKLSDKHIYDVSPCIYTGQYSPYRKSPDYVYGLPIGGIYFLLRRITSELLVGNSIALAFDYSHGSTSKKLAGYKSNRTKDSSIVVQSDFLYDILRECNIPCYRGFGEADDHVHGLSKIGLSNMIVNYDKVIIHSSDYDLAHNVDERGVFLNAVNSNTNNISYSNFSKILGLFEKYDKGIYFNTISAFKTCFSDRSDAIKSPKLISTKGKDVYEGFIKFLSDENVHSAELTSNKELFLSYVNSVVSNEDDIKTLTERANTIFPKDLSSKVGGYSFGDRTTVNMQLLANYCYALRDKVSLSSMARNGFRVSESDESLPRITDKIKTYGKDFKTGVYAADNNLSVSSCFVFGDKVNVRRDF